MPNPKSEYVLRSLQKIINKKWELFIISRIIHKLDDHDIEFITQQLVRREDGTRALTDLYFPQFNIHLEIDEPAHLNNLDDDNRREQDIIFRTDHDIIRIQISENEELSSINNKTDEFIELIKKKKQELVKNKDFEAWEFETKYKPDRFIAKGYFEISDNVLFRKQVDAIRCFGVDHAGWQHGEWQIPDGSGDHLWFPRLFRHGMWTNKLIDGGKVIIEHAEDENGRASIQKQKERYRANPNRCQIIFAKAKDALGANLLRYVGTFRANLDKSTDDYIQFDLVRDREILKRPLKLITSSKIVRD